MKNIVVFLGMYFLISSVQAQPKRIGDSYMGGIIFHLDETQTHGLIANKKDTVPVHWKMAMDLCETKGPGWRLPTKDELALLYKQRNIVGGFCPSDGLNHCTYWSSTFTYKSPIGGNELYYWSADFSNPMLVALDGDAKARVRAVRSF